ncbi:MAG: universal stress protein [Marinirhabdus sp.]|nr:universal stress protein [Marinirhabdus sp.]
MQRILIPTDFSKNAWNATEYALQFFKHQKITFYFVHIDISMQAHRDEDLHHSGLCSVRATTEDNKSKMDSWMETVCTRQSNANHQYKDSIIQAPFVDGIRNFIAKNEIDFVVMGTKGASGLKEMTIGSKTSAVITRVKCPMLVIPENASFTKPLSIGFPTDFNMLYKQRIMRTLLEITHMHHSALKVLRVAQTQKPLANFQDANRDFLKQQLKDVPHSFHVIENPSLETALQLFVDSLQIDMVAMIAKNLNFLQRILFRPKVAQISYHIDIPFLVLHE